jgi:hypothetical protein
MSPTEINRVASLAEELYDRFIVSLADARRAAGRQTYFALSSERGASTYFEPADVGVMQPAHFDFPGGGTAAGLIDALAAYWTAQGETGLAAMVPLLHELSAAVAEEFEEGDGSVDILCYTMF